MPRLMTNSHSNAAARRPGMTVFPASGLVHPILSTALVRRAAHSGSRLYTFGHGIGGSICHVKQGSKGGPNRLERAEQGRPMVRFRGGWGRARTAGRTWWRPCPDGGRRPARRRDELSLLLSLALELRFATRILFLASVPLRVGLLGVRLLAFSHSSRSA